MNDLVSANNPFSSGPGLPMTVNAGSVAIEQERAIAEAQGQLVLAKRFPRDLTASHADLMTACKSLAFAEVAFYSVPNRGSGPSIRFAEEVARVFGNFQYGHRELSRSEGKSEVEVFAWDMQNNNRSIRQLTVMHVIDTRNGAKPCRDQSEVDNLIANKASKQVRGRILSLMPKWLVEDAIRECQKTIAGGNDEPIEVRVRKMTQAFARFGVTTEHLERHLGHKLDAVLMDELVDLQGVFNALREGAKPSEYFGVQDSDDAQPSQAMEKLSAATASAAAAAAAEAKPRQEKAEPEQAKVTEKPARRPRKPADPAPVETKDADPEEKEPVEQQQQSAVEPAADAGQDVDGDEEPEDLF